jgi:hypothetical protein
MARPYDPADAYGAGAPTKADNAGFRRVAAAADRRRNAAYQAGVTGSQPREAFDGDPELGDLHDQGRAEASSTKRAAKRSARLGRARSSSSRWAKGAVRKGVVAPVTARVGSDDLAGVVVGMLGYIVVINYLRGGLPAVRGWFAAKFLNRPYTGPLPVKTGPATAATK